MPTFAGCFKKSPSQEIEFHSLRLLLLCGGVLLLSIPTLLHGQELGRSDSLWNKAEEGVMVTDTLIDPSDTLRSAAAPFPDTLFVENGAIIQLEGEASYYADKFEGRQTSCGERFQQDELTAAHREFPFGTILKVVNLSTGIYTIVRINDRGPWKLHRIIDLSRCAAEPLGMLKGGVANVRLEILRWGP